MKGSMLGSLLKNMTKSVLLGLGVLSLAAPVPVAVSAEESLRYFSYSSHYGQRLTPPEAYRDVIFSLSGKKVSLFFTGDDLSDNYVGPAEEGLNGELLQLLAGLDFSNWDMPIDAKHSSDLSEAKKEKVCRWCLDMILDAPGKKQREVRLEGADYGENKGRIAVEKALIAFFREKLPVYQAKPKHLESLSWSMPGKGTRAQYWVSRHDDGKVAVSRLGPRKVEAFVRPSFLHDLQTMMQDYPLDSWHGPCVTGTDRNDPAYEELSLKFDTLQTVFVCGKAGEVGERIRTSGFEALLRSLTLACDKALDAGGGAVPRRADALKAFYFAETGMRMGKYPGYELYLRMGDAGPEMILQREVGYDNCVECSIRDEELKGFESLLKELDIASWDGFNGNEKNVLDGRSFSLSVTYWNGKTISANGYMRFPRDYAKKMSRVYALLDEVLVRHGIAPAER